MPFTLGYSSPILYRIIFVAGFLLLAMALFAQVKSGAYRLMLNGLLSHDVPELGVQEVFNHRTSFVFLDAREPREFEVSHIAGAVPVGYDHFDVANLPKDLPKDAHIVVYCSVGYRSEKVTEKLEKAGYSHVSNLYGGVFEWVNQGFPVVDDKGQTDLVHAYSHSWGVWLNKGRKVYK